VLRRRPLLQHLAQSGTGALERRLAILAWQGSANLLRGALGRNEQQWRQQVKAIDPAGFSDKLRHNLPDWLASALRSQLGDDEFWPLVAALDEPAPLDLRVNVLKAKRDDVLSVLAEAGIDAAPTPFSPWGLRVPGKPALHKLDAFVRGDIEVQDEGSQLLAAAGGRQARRDGGRLLRRCRRQDPGAGRGHAQHRAAVCLRRQRPPARRAEAALARSGLSNVHPAQIAHERDDRIKRLAGKIDRVLVDAPCSGLGTLRRNPDLKWRQSPQAVAELRPSRPPSWTARSGCSSRAGGWCTPPAACCATRTRPSPRPSAPRTRTSCPCRPTRLLAAACTSTAEANWWRRLPAAVAAPACHRRLLRRGLAAPLIRRGLILRKPARIAAVTSAPSAGTVRFQSYAQSAWGCRGRASTIKSPACSLADKAFS
jgi:hypothetical protein